MSDARTVRTCATPGCNNPVIWKGWSICPSCNYKWKRDHPTVVQPPITKISNHVLSVDMSTTGSVGLCVMNSKEKITEYKELPWDGRSYSARRNEIIKEMEDILSRHTCDLIVVERVTLYHKGYITFNSIKTLWGLTIRIIDRFGDQVPVYEVSATSWKADILHNKSASKEDAVSYVKFNYGLDVCHDVADSICIGVYSVRHPQWLTKLSD